MQPNHFDALINALTDNILTSAVEAVMEPQGPSVPALRFLNSWEDNPLPAYDFNWSVADQKKFDDVESIDEICVRISRLPTMQAELENYPEMSSVPIFAWNAGPEDETTSGKYHPLTGFVDFNVNAGYFSDRVARGCGTVPHELRHAEQDTNSCLAFPESSILASDYESRIALQRLTEADATVFSITVAMEILMINHDIKPLELLKTRRPASTIAYCIAMMKDKESHWDGRAANAALKAYLCKDNQGLLDMYDATLCQSFLSAERSGYVLAPRDRNYERLRNKAFAEFVEPMRRMPFIDKKGHMEERPNYWNGIDLSPSKLCKGLSSVVNYKLLHAHMRDLSLG